MMLACAVIILLILLFLLCSKISLVHRTKRSDTTSTISNNNDNLPPGRTGWPIIGETFAYLSRPEKFIRDRIAKYSSNVFKTSLLGEKMAVLCGPWANKFIFSNESKLIKLWLPPSDPLSHSDLDVDSSSWKLANRLTFKFLRLESLQQYVGVMDSMAREHLDTLWAPFNEARVYPLTKEFTFAVSCRLFIGQYSGSMSPERVKELSKPFFLVREGMISAPVNLPGTCYHKAVRGGELGLEKLLDIIRQRKIEMGYDHIGRNDEEADSQDLLGRLLMASDEDGKFIKEKDIAITIAGILLASSYTTNNTITSLVSHLADHPHAYEKVHQEHLEIAKSKRTGERITWADIQKMKYSWNAVCETLRLTAPGQGGGFREVINDFKFESFNIPKGWKVYWTVHGTHKNPEFFPDPEKFDPTRFEGSGPLPFTFVPFGGGPRMCVGKEYARIQILVFLHNLVTRFRLTKANPNEKIVYNPGPIPVEGLRVRLKPHQK